jgi:hypothetical protein
MLMKIEFLNTTFHNSRDPHADVLSLAQNSLPVRPVTTWVNSQIQPRALSVEKNSKRVNVNGASTVRVSCIVRKTGDKQ